MTALHRMRVEWTGFAGGPGVSTFYGLTGGSLGSAVFTMLDAMKGGIPDDCHIKVQNQGDIIESTTGAITGSWLAGDFLTVLGSSVSPYAAPVGLLLRWQTGTIVAGRRLRGHTFLVPAASLNFSTTGQVEPSLVAGFQPFIDTFLASTVGDLVVWSRPRAARAATATQKALAARVGSYGLVLSGSVSPKAVVLRTRRD